MFTWRDVLQHPWQLKCLHTVRSLDSLTILNVYVYMLLGVHFSSKFSIQLQWICIVLFFHLQFNSHCMFHPCSAIEARHIVYWFGECFFFAGLSVAAIVCFILVIVEATYIVYWFGECFFFAGLSVVACCCLAGDSSCASSFHPFGVSFDVVVSFCIPCLLFSL